jgi:hypothetical protein
MFWNDINKPKLHSLRADIIRGTYAILQIRICFRLMSFELASQCLGCIASTEKTIAWSNGGMVIGLGKRSFRGKSLCSDTSCTTSPTLPNLG